MSGIHLFPIPIMFFCCHLFYQFHFIVLHGVWHPYAQASHFILQLRCIKCCYDPACHRNQIEWRCWNQVKSKNVFFLKIFEAWMMIEMLKYRQKIRIYRNRQRIADSFGQRKKHKNELHTMPSIPLHSVKV